MREYQNIAEFLEDHEDEVVVSALLTYYDLCNRQNKINNSDMGIEPDQEILDAIALVLRDFMPPSDYLKWLNSIDTKDKTMSNYTKALTAEQLIYFIANDRPELSHEKVLWQRNEYIKICREWLELNGQN
jgi:hypothetical protein